MPHPLGQPFTLQKLLDVLKKHKIPLDKTLLLGDSTGYNCDLSLWIGDKVLLKQTCPEKGDGLFRLTIDGEEQ